MIVFIKKYKNIFIQALVFIVLGYFRQHPILLGFGILLLLMALIVPKLADLYLQFLENLLRFIGTQIKRMLFLLMYIFVITPIGVIVKSKTKNGFEKQLGIIDFNKMW